MGHAPKLRGRRRVELWHLRRVWLSRRLREKNRRRNRAEYPWTHAHQLDIPSTKTSPLSSSSSTPDARATANAGTGDTMDVYGCQRRSLSAAT